MLHRALPEFDALAVQDYIFDARLVRLALVRIAVHRASLPTATISGVMPRRVMRDGGASTKCQSLPSASTSISLCGFSNVDFWISPVTSNAFAVSYPLQP